MKEQNPDICVWCEAESHYRTGTADKMTEYDEFYLPKNCDLDYFDFNHSAGITKSQLQQMRALFITMEGLVNNLHEKTSIIITTNKAPAEWV